MNILVKTVRLIVWTVVLTLMTTIAGVCMYATYRIVQGTDWEKLESIGMTLAVLLGLIVVTFIAGGFVLWAIREHVLPLSPEEQEAITPGKS